MSRAAVQLADFIIGGGGSVYTVLPTTDAADEHLRENVQDDAQWFGRALAVEHRYIGSLCDALRGEGFSLEVSQ